MSINKPFKRTYRPFINERGSSKFYIFHTDYAIAPEHYIRAFLLLQKDFLTLLDFIEPSDGNLSTYSFRTYELLLRVCTEVEANFKAILEENGYKNNKNNWDMSDYKKVNESHKLSQYKVKIPIWDGDNSIRTPFIVLNNNKSPNWWKAYNNSKHNRHTKFKEASFSNLLDAISALVVLISAQFLSFTFTKNNYDVLYSTLNYEIDDYDETVGEFFRIKYPTEWEVDEKYDFKWHELEKQDNPIQKYNYK